MLLFAALSLSPAALPGFGIDRDHHPFVQAVASDFESHHQDSVVIL